MTIGKLHSAPVFYTVCQAQYNPLLGLAAHIPAIQEEMRMAGYPDYQRTLQLQLRIEGGKPIPEQSEVFRFLNISGTSAYVLQANAISYETVAYDRFADFLNSLVRGLEIVSAAVGGLAYVDRVGIRYLDAVAPRAGETLTAYLSREMLGLRNVERPVAGAAFTYSFAESSFSVEGVGQITARSLVQSGPLAFPADLQAGLKVSAKFASISGEHAVLDTDGFVTTRIPYDVAAVQIKLDQLHELCAKVFEASVTPHAIATWRLPA